MLALLCSSLVLLPLGPEPNPMALFRQWSRSPSPELRVQAVRTLRGCNGRDTRVALYSLLDDDDAGVRAAVRDEIVRRSPDEGPELTLEIAALRDERARLEGLRAILERKEDPTIFLDDRRPDVRARALFSHRIDRARAAECLRDRDAAVRALALEVAHDAEAAARFARDRAEEPRIAAARVLTEPEPLAALLGDRSWRVRLAGIHAAERVRSKALLPALIEVLDTEPGRVRARAVEALEGLTRVPFGDDVKRWRAWWRRSGATFELPPPRAGASQGHSRSVVAFRRIPVVSKRLSFVLDASRSMEKPAPGGGGLSRWDLVVRDVSAVLDRLDSATRFNVIFFRTEIEAWRPRLAPATTGNRKACEEWIRAAKPAGWTNLYDALALALADDAVDCVYVLSDGVPSRGTETARYAILHEIAYLNHYRLVQVNCVQAGSEKGLGKAWRGFLDELAKAHDGVAVRE